ncbi:MAG: hypothetical protein A2836_03805 [Candidatus Taylorbacteria bacterium RIFCSPHIGHO2_01_FULL_45_63]|uniref:CMP/dCMP-type deaminase domain-containing protein n=1 Tax=Candidatus Taylorbacteria bacterium RIFCSPHIGHO2_02_FULL_45_35 TaxID=1802311 RepID=A0A1G2MPM3_9BACT|nr:MAG: hypothetical protein A2836_03805 [Candidatus Taylorbacteria bacterium RIFCSPHIGHO2_01_FULL_45_63]OHA25816.1 MAG: hypothetical protein A3D56_00995 [Candidatus Taylorbacteria bacterium RIFCSPHIGHO2_02_FULL_45_35]OHA34350.1 MAG: hypothetical protein A3A22_00505 [Candidatus Taylorbacteria bacterium RIFCSPLOWO2_01_FULL_45_34b]
MKIIVAYIPVIHEGYWRFFEKHKDAETLYILGTSITKQYRPLVKDIRALDPELVKESLLPWKLFKNIEILEQEGFSGLTLQKSKVIMPDEDVSRDIAERSFKGTDIEFDSIFLRWDKHKSQAEQVVEIDQKISVEEFDKKIIRALGERAEKKSSDFWRRIGSAIVKDGKVILETYNKHVPSEHAPYVAGDPRSDFSQGIHVELSSSLHSEAGIIAEAARRGLALQGLDMYVSTFPCPPCAKSIAYSGIKRLFYSGGYAVLDGVPVLKDQGVEIIFVKF